MNANVIGKWDKRITSALPTSRNDTADLDYRDEDGEAAEDQCGE